MFDAFDLVRRGASLRGKLDRASLPRAADRLAPDGDRAEVSWQITGTTDPSGRPALKISLDGVVPLVCQRCLQAFAWPVAQETLVLLSRSERELALLDADDEHEVVLAASPLDAVALAEDELLLTLPFVPRCERAGCAEKGFAAADAADNVVAPSAFAALAALKAGARKRAKKSGK